MCYFPKALTGMDTKRRAKRKLHTRRSKLRRKNARYRSRGGSVPDKIIVIDPVHQGLGDNLQYTTLPELYSKHGYDVYISSKTKFRSNELYDLIWKLNPYIKGLSDLPPNAGINKVEANKSTNSYIKNIELGHDLTDGYRKYPVVYYKPNKIEGIDNFLFYDPTFVSSLADTNFKNSFKTIFDKYPTMIPHMIKFKQAYDNNPGEKIKKNSINSLETAVYEIENIKHFCDVLFSCKVFVCGFSGGSVLASAIKQDNPTPEIYSFQTPVNIRHDIPSYFKFDNVQYLPIVQ